MSVNEGKKAALRHNFKGKVAERGRQHETRRLPEAGKKNLPRSKKNGLF